MRGDYKTSNTMVWAIFGFVFCLFWPLATYICSGIALYQSKGKTGERIEKVKVVSIISIVFSTIFVLIITFFM